MTADSTYDTTLTERVRVDLAAMDVPSLQDTTELATLIDRLDGDVRRWLADPPRKVRTLDFLRGGSTSGPPSGSRPPSAPEPVRRTLSEIASMSSRLDSAAEPSEGFSVAETVASTAHEWAHIVEGFLSALDPSDAISSRFHRLVAYLGQLIRNAVAKMQAFAKLLGVSSFSVAFATAPPNVTVTFTFGTG